MKCNICSSQTKKIFSKKVLFKYDVGYYQCQQCSFIQTEKPFWLNESYSKVISDSDTGILVRNTQIARVVELLISYFFNPKGVFLDYAGGVGLFCRTMRDKGFDFYSHDKYCKNVLSSHFTLIEIEKKARFEMVTAFEMLEHVEHPTKELKRLLEHTDSIFVTTELVPNEITEIENWMYLTPETGQHISFLSLKALAIIGKELNVNVLSNGQDRHFFTKKNIPDFAYRLMCSNRINRFIPSFNKTESKTLHDHELILNEMHHKINADVSNG